VADPVRLEPLSDRRVGMATHDHAASRRLIQQDLNVCLA
jgi:hypothetical protein